MAIEGTADTEVFRAYVRHVLCPTLHPGDVVILDNLAPHKSQPTLSLIEAAGAAIRFLPAYSPDLNPIEETVEQSQSQPADSRSTNAANAGSSDGGRFGGRDTPRCQELVCLVWLQFYLNRSS